MKDLFILGTAAAGTDAGVGSMLTMVVVWVVIMAVMFYFLQRPQKKEQKRLQELLDNLAVGDSVLTTSGMYGVVIDIMPEIVVVEFGSNKNCRIPMKKSAIVEVEKAENPGTAEAANKQATAAADDKNDKKKDAAK